MISIALETFFECGTYMTHTGLQENCFCPVLCGSYMYHTAFSILYVISVLKYPKYAKKIYIFTLLLK